MTGHVRTVLSFKQGICIKNKNKKNNKKDRSGVVLLIDTVYVTGIIITIKNVVREGIIRTTKFP